MCDALGRRVRLDLRNAESEIISEDLNEVTAGWLRIGADEPSSIEFVNWSFSFTTIARVSNDDSRGSNYWDSSFSSCCRWVLSFVEWIIFLSARNSVTWAEPAAYDCFFLSLAVADVELEEESKYILDYRLSCETFDCFCVSEAW